MPDRPIKLLTYNVHSCIGSDRKLDPGRIAAVIAETEADIIALQEVDVGRRRTDGIDQAHVIASLLKMQAHFHPALSVAEEKYGDAIITALPTGAVKSGPLPSIGETRGALSVEITVGDRKLLVVNTHLGLRGRERIRQMTTLLNSGWLHGMGQNLPANRSLWRSQRHSRFRDLSARGAVTERCPARRPGCAESDLSLALPADAPRPHLRHRRSRRLQGGGARNPADEGRLGPSPSPCGNRLRLIVRCGQPAPDIRSEKRRPTP
ncbi:hypothetical protein ACVITL_006229 [Rhizobium pisi]